MNNGLYCGKILELDKGARCSLHYHTFKHETFYVLSGIVDFKKWPLVVPVISKWWEIPGEETRLFAGDIVTIEPLTPHQFLGVAHSKIIEFSTHHSDDDVFRFTESEAAPISAYEEHVTSEATEDE